jgi:hypothetical protein
MAYGLKNYIQPTAFENMLMCSLLPIATLLAVLPLSIYYGRGSFFLEALPPVDSTHFVASSRRVDSHSPAIEMDNKTGH